MHTAINAKFKKGDRVVSAGGNRGVVTEVYGEGWYAVHYDGDRPDLDNKIQEYQLRAANSHMAYNARVSSVRDFTDLLNGIEEDMENPDWGWEWRAERKLLDELKPFARKYGKMPEWQYVDGLVRRAANCSTANSVVAKAVANARAANTAFKVGDKVKANPKFLEFCPPEMKGREWTVTGVYGRGLGDGFFDLKSGDKTLSGIPAVKCVSANSSAEPTVAKNGAADVLVSFMTVTAKGLEKVQARMTESDFDVWAKKVGAGDTQNVYKELATSGKAGFAITRPLSVTVTQL